MKFRKGILVLGILTFIFIGGAIGMYFLLPMIVDGFKVPYFDDSFNSTKDAVLAFFQTGFTGDIVAQLPAIITLGVCGLALLIGLIWLIIDLVRRRFIVFYFFLAFLVDAAFVSGLMNNVYKEIYDAIAAGGSFSFNLFAPLRLVYGGLAIFAYLFLIIVFIVDLATGKKKKAAPEETPAPAFGSDDAHEASPVYEEVKDEEEPAPAPAPVEEAPTEEAPVEEEEEPVEEEPTANEGIVDEPKEKPAAKKKAPAKKAAAKKEPAKKAEKADARSTQSITLINEDGQPYAKAYHVSRRPELNKWQVKATGSDKALKLFNTQKEAIEYANQLAKSQNVSVRVHSKAGKIRKDRSATTAAKK